jgi:hypothetical protein
VTYFRSDPNAKDLFVTYTGFTETASEACSTNAGEEGWQCRFAVGGAFSNAGVDVHALRSTATSPGEQNIDVLMVTNDKVGFYGLTAPGNINKRSGARDWSWDTKGSSSVGTATDYANGNNDTTMYQIPLEKYFTQKPYRDGDPSNCVPPNGFLDPVSDSSLVEDANDNGVINGPEAKKISGTGCSNSDLDGDLYIVGSYSQALTAFDIDNDSEVELPLATIPGSINPNYEYTKLQSLRSTITHEIGHAVGMTHNSINTDLMYEYSNNWSRDHTFSSTAESQMHIHNN